MTWPRWLTINLLPQQGYSYLLVIIEIIIIIPQVCLLVTSDLALPSRTDDVEDFLCSECVEWHRS